MSAHNSSTSIDAADKASSSGQKKARRASSDGGDRKPVSPSSSGSRSRDRRTNFRRGEEADARTRDRTHAATGSKSGRTRSRSRQRRSPSMTNSEKKLAFEFVLERAGVKPRQHDGLSAFSVQSYATAIDFDEHGHRSVHKCWAAPSRRGARPEFLCPVGEHSVRLVFIDRPTIPRKGRPRPRRRQSWEENRCGRCDYTSDEETQSYLSRDSSRRGHSRGRGRSRSVSRARRSSRGSNRGRSMGSAGKTHSDRVKVSQDVVVDTAVERTDAGKPENDEGRPASVDASNTSAVSNRILSDQSLVEEPSPVEAKQDKDIASNAPGLAKDTPSKDNSWSRSRVRALATATLKDQPRGRTASLSNNQEASTDQPCRDRSKSPKDHTQARTENRSQRTGSYYRGSWNSRARSRDRSCGRSRTRSCQSKASPDISAAEESAGLRNNRFSDALRRSGRDRVSDSTDEDWKAYRGAHSIQATSCFRFWDRDASQDDLLVGVNLMFDTINFEDGENDDIVWRRRMKKERHMMVLSSSLMSFYTIPSVFRAEWPLSGGLQIHGLFFTTEIPDSHFVADIYRCPLRDDLWNLLLETNTATALHGGDLDLAARLAAFDIFRAAMRSWTDFLSYVLEKSAWRPSDFKTFERDPPLVGDRELVADFARATRDLLAAVVLAEEAVDLIEDLSDHNLRKWRHLKLQSKTGRERLENLVKDVEQYIDSFVARSNALTQEAQAASLKRLTLVASIFLPLTMACSLLSMSNRVNEVGAVWWDWLGIVLIIGLLIVIGIKVTSIISDFRRKPRWQFLRKSIRQEFAKAEARALEYQKDKPSHLRQRHLVPLTPRLLFRSSRYLFLLGATISFLVGMFIQGGDVTIGAEALGWSTAGVVGYVIAGIVVWRLLKGIWLLVRSHAKDDASERSHTTRSSVAGSGLGSRTSSRNTRQSRKERSLPRRLLSKILHVFAGISFRFVWWWLKVAYWVFTFFFGSLLLEVAMYMALKVISVNIPDTVIEMFQGWLFNDGGDTKEERTNDHDAEAQHDAIEDSEAVEKKIEVTTSLGPVNLLSEKPKRAQTWNNQKGLARTRTAPPEAAGVGGARADAPGTKVAGARKSMDEKARTVTHVPKRAQTTFL